jgi:hypothetical protein
MWGGHCLKSWSSTQDVIALSSGEAEYYAIVKGVSQALGMKQLLNNLGRSTLSARQSPLQQSPSRLEEVAVE